MEFGEEDFKITEEACELLKQAADYYFRYLVDPIGNGHLFNYYEYYILGIEIMIDDGEIFPNALKCFMWWRKRLAFNYFNYYGYPHYLVVVPELKIGNKVLVRGRVAKPSEFILEGCL